MKSKEEIKELAYQIYKLEKQAQKFNKQGEVKRVQDMLSKIKNILETLSLREGLELNDIVLELFDKDETF